MELCGVRLLIAITTSDVIQNYNFFTFLKKRLGKLTKVDVFNLHFTMHFRYFLLFLRSFIKFINLKFCSNMVFIDIFLILCMLGKTMGDKLPTHRPAYEGHRIFIQQLQIVCHTF